MSNIDGTTLLSRIGETRRSTSHHTVPLHCNVRQVQHTDQHNRFDSDCRISTFRKTNHLHHKGTSLPPKNPIRKQVYKLNIPEIAMHIYEIQTFFLEECDMILYNYIQIVLGFKNIISYPYTINFDYELFCNLFSYLCKSVIIHYKLPVWSGSRKMMYVSCNHLCTLIIPYTLYLVNSL